MAVDQNDRDRVRVAVEIDWVRLGVISLVKEKLKFPEGAAQAPGVYRFSLHSPTEAVSVYIGEAVLLDRRFAHYRNPGPTQWTNLWVNERVRAVLDAGGSVTVDIATEILVEVDGTTMTTDLSYRPFRLLAENAALLDARHSGVKVENL